MSAAEFQGAGSASRICSAVPRRRRVLPSLGIGRVGLLGRLSSRLRQGLWGCPDGSTSTRRSPPVGSPEATATAAGKGRGRPGLGDGDRAPRVFPWSYVDHCLRTYPRARILLDSRFFPHLAVAQRGRGRGWGALAMMEKGDGGRLETSSVRLMWLLQGACVTKEPGWTLPCMPLSAVQVDQQSARLGLEGFWAVDQQAVRIRAWIV